MSLEIKIKKEFESEKLAFGGSNSHLPLGKRTDIDKLAMIARKSNNKHLLRLFESIPTLEELQSHQADSFIEKTEPLVRATKNKKHQTEITDLRAKDAGEQEISE